MTKFISGLFLICFLLSACQSPEPKTLPDQVAFFDLKDYFHSEIEKLSLTTKVTKTTQINGETEVREFDTLDFNTELAPFIDSDINRTAWLDQYQVDSVFLENGALASITYKALKPELKTQKLYIAFEEKKPSRIQVEKLMENALMNAFMELEYIPGKSYRIQSNQKLRISEERIMVVSVEL